MRCAGSFCQKYCIALSLESMLSVVPTIPTFVLISDKKICVEFGFLLYTSSSVRKQRIKLYLVARRAIKKANNTVLKST